MASTTLITFMLQAPTTVFSVEILGSWDNFSKPYQLKRDRKTGPAQWRGCHTFENITCDGDTLNAFTSRDGGLKMGGTYWYYYLLDGDIEYHDPAEPSTNLCPLLPGQTVNILDVPVQGEMSFGGSHGDSASSLDSAVFTLDPKDKYLSPGVRRATTTSAVHSRNVRLAPTTRPATRVLRNSSIGTEVGPQTSKTATALLTLERQRSLLSVFHRMRQTRSAGSNTKSSLPRKIFTRAGQSTQQLVSDRRPQTLKLPDHASNVPLTRIGCGPDMSMGQPSTAVNPERQPATLMPKITLSENDFCRLEHLASSNHGQLPISSAREQGVEDGHATSSARNSEVSLRSSRYTLQQPQDTLTYRTPTPVDETNGMALSGPLERVKLAPGAEETLIKPVMLPLNKELAVAKAAPSPETLGSLELNFDSAKYGYAESLASYATSANFSPCLASSATHTGPTSPCHLSEPETPVMSDFGDDFLPPLRDSESLALMRRSSGSDLDLLLPWPSSRAAPPRQSQVQGGTTSISNATKGGFQGYSLPDHDHASVLTIRKLPSNSFKKADGASPFTRQGSKEDLVHSWNDGSENRVTALGELVDDLGYLGEVII